MAIRLCIKDYNCNLIDFWLTKKVILICSYQTNSKFNIHKAKKIGPKTGQRVSNLTLGSVEKFIGD